MNNRTLINNELQSIAPALVAAPVAMPYTLPPDYFLRLAPHLLDLVKEETVSLTGVSKEMPYAIPAGYFAQFAQSVLQKLGADKDDTLDQSEEQFSFSTASKKMPYAVPENYFETLPKVMLAKASAPKQQSIPAGYFESLPELMLAKVRQMESKNELDEVAPLLNTISKKPVQHVPQGYFEKLQPAIPQQENNVPIVSIGSKKGWLKYAAAASVAIMLSFGAYFLFSNSKTPVPSVANQPTLNVINDELASLDTKTIENYLQTTGASVATTISVDDLENLDNATLDKLLQDFTDQQLKKHIEETPELPSLTNTKKS